MSLSASSNEVLCTSCGGTAEVIATDPSGQKTAVCSFCYATVTVDSRGRVVEAAGRSAAVAETAARAEKADKPKKAPKPKKPPPPDPATIVRAVLTRAGIGAGSPAVAPHAKLEPLSADQVGLVERVGEHLEYLRRAEEGDVAEAFSGLTEAVALGDLNPQMKSDALELIEELGRQASLPEQERSGKAVLRSVMEGLGSTFVGARSLSESWRSASRRIEAFLGVD